MSLCYFQYKWQSNKKQTSLEPITNNQTSFFRSVIVPYFPLFPFSQHSSFSSTSLLFTNSPLFINNSPIHQFYNPATVIVLLFIYLLILFRLLHVVKRGMNTSSSDLSLFPSMTYEITRCKSTIFA